jgi:hypothetical protein
VTDPLAGALGEAGLTADDEDVRVGAHRPPAQLSCHRSS